MHFNVDTPKSLSIKKIITEVPLYCIASFVIGVYTTLLINFFYFDNNITVAGVSALIAAMALLFTIYAALKVKEWVDSKVNEKAFEQTEKMIEHLAQFHLKTDQITTRLSMLDSIDLANDIETFNRIIDQVKGLSKVASDDLVYALATMRSLGLWNSSVNPKIVLPLIRKINNEFGKLSDSILVITDHHSLNNPHHCLDEAKSVVDVGKKLSDHLYELFALPYSDIFLHNLKKDY